MITFSTQEHIARQMDRPVHSVVASSAATRKIMGYLGNFERRRIKENKIGKKEKKEEKEKGKKEKKLGEKAKTKEEINKKKNWEEEKVEG